MKRFIAVAGNIGVGKSTLVGLLSERLDWQPFYEPVAENPYLADFYRDMRAWSFHSQIFFLTRRLRIHRQLIDHPGSAIQDRSVYEDAEIFASNLYRQGLIDERDYISYRELYQVLTEFLPPPDLVIYLRASVATLNERIHQRGRDYERHITPSTWHSSTGCTRNGSPISTCARCLTVPADDLNYVAYPTHLNLIVKKVEEKLMGKEEVVFGPDEVVSL